jgi:CRP-like cAMP-binding protein
VYSISLSTADGRAAGVALVGNEGLIGMSELGADPESGETATVEIVDVDAQMMDVTVFQRETAPGGALHDVVHRYVQTFTASLMRSVACNALHSIEQRFARCLLEIRDRIGSNELPLTQGTLARILGVRRASITVAAGTLHRAGIIDHGHKQLVILDPVRLEGVACDCYAVIKEQFARW